jgi:hypothetical protein
MSVSLYTFLQADTQALTFLGKKSSRVTVADRIGGAAKYSGLVARAKENTGAHLWRAQSAVAHGEEMGLAANAAFRWCQTRRRLHRELSAGEAAGER